MGGGSWSRSAYTSLSMTKDYDSAKSIKDILKNIKTDDLMSPQDVTLRESRDSDEHPTSLAVMIWLDVTGSMYDIPLEFVKNSMPTLMGGLLKSGIEHPQIFFGAIGDHKTDNAPVQIGQFESSTELIDRWLTGTFFEGRGGGNGGESYLAAWYFAGFRTSIDCVEKRGEKGFLFTIGDEPTHLDIQERHLRRIFGRGEYPTQYTARELLEKAQEKYNVYHLHINQAQHKDDKRVFDGWRELLGENFVVIEDYSKLGEEISKIVSSKESLVTSETITSGISDDIL